MPPLSRRAAGGYETRNIDFVQQYVEKRSQKKERPRALTAAERAAHRKELSKFRQQSVLSDETLINISGILRKWKAYVLWVSSSVVTQLIGAQVLCV